VGVQKWVRTDIKRVRAALERPERGRDLLRSPDFERGDLKAERARCSLSFAHFQHCGRILEIGQNRQTAKTLDNLAQEFEPFAGKIGALQRQAGDVAPRPRQARDEAAADRVVCCREHDRND
jgi:hypothetical protein